MDFDLKYWAGTEESLAIYLLCLKKMVANGDIQAYANSITRTGGQQDQEEELPRLLSMSGDVGVIKIAGPLVNSDSRYNRFYGITGYPEIREALVHAAKDEKIGAIVLDIASGGGAVSGVFDTAALINTIDKQVKPVHAFSDGGVLSAAYLLGSSARKVNITRMTEAGSIGVVYVHQEMTKMLEEIGIKPTVFRGGKYKALGNPYEPLTDEAKAEIQKGIDHMYKVFVEHVAEQRRVTYAVADDKMAQGRVFTGEGALAAGLVDDITSFDKVMSKVQGGIDSKNKAPKYGADFTNNKNKGIAVSKEALTEQQIAALAEGGGMVEGSAATGAEHGGGSGGAPAAESQTETPAANAEGTPAATKPVAEPSALQLVQTMLAESQAKVANLTIELRDEKTKGEALAASHTPMREIAVTSVKRMKVALGQTAGGEEALNDEALLAAHVALRTTFETKFKTGGVAAVAPASDDTAGSKATVDPTHQARIAATRPNR